MSRHLLAKSLAMAAMALSVSLSPAAAFDRHAYRNFSRARFIGIGNRLCGKQSRITQNCCAFNDGLWRPNPPPGHCLLL